MKYTHCFAAFDFAVDTLSYVFVDSRDMFIHISKGCFTGTGTNIWLPQYS